MEEQQFSDRHTKKKLRPFSCNLGVNYRGYSKPFQRIICDFGADHSFIEATRKVAEHYNVEVPESTVRKITEEHANKIFLQEESGLSNCRAQSQIIAETDGCFIPIVETGLDTEEYVGDGRKKRTLGYKEARLSLAHAQGSKDLTYAGTFQSIEVAGEQLAKCVNQVGIDEHTNVHCVGDGAKWIANQVEEQFGTNGNYLIDFYHLCEYLSAAAPVCAINGERNWMNRQKALLKASNISPILLDLRRHREHSDIPDEQAPVRVCLRYMENRLNQLDYKTAIDKGLPIGSGEIESAHRYVVQKRLKLAGAAWKLDNANNMLALRVNRANERWNNYWNINV